VTTSGNALIGGFRCKGIMVTGEHTTTTQVFSNRTRRVPENHPSQPIYCHLRTHRVPKFPPPAPNIMCLVGLFQSYSAVGKGR
jgi:hypothetical protein